MSLYDIGGRRARRRMVGLEPICCACGFEAEMQKVLGEEWPDIGVAL